MDFERIPTISNKKSESVQKKTEATPEFLPVNVPSYQEIISSTRLNEVEFTQKDYERYCESLRERMHVIIEQTERLRGMFDRLRNIVEVDEKQKPSGLFLAGQEQLKRIDERLDVALHQKDFFSVIDSAYLPEVQLDSLSEDLRGLKEILMYAALQGSYQSPATDQKHAQQGFQRSRVQNEVSDIAPTYARFNAAPENIENKLHSVVSLPEGIEGKTFLYGSGMGALAGVSTFALTETAGSDSKILFGASSYFETQAQADIWRKTLPPEKVVTFDEREEGDFDRALEQNPRVIVTEHVVNTSELPVVPIEKITKHPYEGDGIRFIIIDYTMSGPTFDVSRYIDKIGDNDVLVLVTSLQKLYQEGDDMVPGGMATFAVSKTSTVSLRDMESRIRLLRGVLGVNATTQSIISLSLTNPDAIRSHAEQIGRNVSELAASFPRENKVVSSIFEPPRLATGTSEGMVFTVNFSDVSTKERFMARALELAERKGIRISEGSSFGFRSTRLWTNRQPINDSLTVRIAPGTENERQVAVLKQIFSQAVEFASGENGY